MPNGDIPGPRGRRKRIAVDYLFIRQSGAGVTGATARKCNELWTRNQRAMSGIKRARERIARAHKTSRFINYINADG